MQHHIVFLDREGIAPSIVLRRPVFAHRWSDHDFTPPDEVVPRLKDATIALTCSIPLREKQLRQLPHLKMISLALTGTDIVDLDYCRAHGITVTNVPAYAANTAAEHTLAMMFELLRRPCRYHRMLRDIRDGKAPLKGIYHDFPIRDVRGRTLAIVGRGPIAQRLAELGRALGMQVFFHDRNGQWQGEEFLPMKDLLARCDVLSLNVPLNDSTRDLIGAAELALMKPTAVVINTARGGIVNEAALIDALQSGRIAGAALDVVVDEPVQPDNPLLALLDHDNFILTPHVAWSSEDAMQGLIDRALANITHFVEANEAGLAGYRVC